MNINAELTSSRTFSLQAFFNGGKKTAGVTQNTSGQTAGSVEIIFSSKTELTLQAEDITKSRENGSPKAPESSVADFPGGYWGIEQTSARIAGFVLNGAGDDVEKLRIGRDAIMQGFCEAEKIWGGTLPDISYKTIDAAVAAIDGRLRQLEAPVMDVVV